MEEIVIKASSGSVFVDQFDERVWVSIHVDSGSARAILSVEQAREMVEAINNVIAKVQA
jgi:hypothetical protein